MGSIKNVADWISQKAFLNALYLVGSSTMAGFIYISAYLHVVKGYSFTNLINFLVVLNTTDIGSLTILLVITGLFLMGFLGEFFFTAYMYIIRHLVLVFRHLVEKQKSKKLKKWAGNIVQYLFYDVSNEKTTIKLSNNHFNEMKSLILNKMGINESWHPDFIKLISYYSSTKSSATNNNQIVYRAILKALFLSSTLYLIHFYFLGQWMKFFLTYMTSLIMFETIRQSYVDSIIKRLYEAYFHLNSKV